MTYDEDKKARQKRREKLVTGDCGCGKNPAQIPWEGGKYCYKCFNRLMRELKIIKEG